MTYEMNANLKNALATVKVELVELDYVAACFEVSAGRVRGMLKANHEDVEGLEKVELFSKTYFIAINVRDAASDRKDRLAKAELDRVAKAAEKAEKAERNAGPTKLQLQVACQENGIRYSGRNREQLMDALAEAKIELPIAAGSE